MSGIERRTAIVLRDAAHQTFTDPLAGLAESEERRANRFIAVRRVDIGWSVSRKVRYAGLLQVGDVSYWLAPPFSAASFVYLLLQRSGSPQAAERAYALASSQRNRSLLDLMPVLAMTMVSEAARLASGHIAQSYATRTEQMGVVRGRPLWHKQTSRPADGSVYCRFSEKTTNTLENRLVVAGLQAAERWIGPGSGRSQLRSQQRIWRSLADPMTPARHDFDLAELRLNRLTEGYRSAFSVARSLLFGFDLEGTRADTEINAPVFDLAELFETLVYMTAKLAVKGTGLEVSAQTSERRAVVTSNGSVYRRIRPDVVFSRDGVPEFVLECKFKPQYAQGGPSPGSANRISREDIFQTFFYASRLAQRAGLSRPIPSGIAAPAFLNSAPPSSEFRRIYMGDETETESSPLNLVLFPVDAAVSALISGDIGFCRQIFRETSIFASGNGSTVTSAEF